MKKLLLSATAFLTVAVSLQAQQVKPCGTYEAREYYLKNLPGYAAKVNAAEAAAQAEYQAFLQKNSQAAKTATVSGPTYTVPVVFHILHQGEPLGVGPNIDDINCVNALAQVNRDFGRQGTDVNTIDPLFAPLYVDSKMQFMLAQKDPNGNCTNGVVHHYDSNTNWSRDLLNYQYSTYGAGSWNPFRYLNIYIVKNIDGSSAGITVGYTYLPGTSPVPAADAIVYRYDFLGGLGARALSHEIGHWFGLSHTFGSTNNPGFECGNDDIGDTPATTGFFSTCPKPGYNYTLTPTVTNPTDASDITSVKFGKMYNNTAVNSLTGYMRTPLFTMVATTVTPTMDSANVTGLGTAGAYSDFTLRYGNDFNVGAANISITSSALPTDSNDVAVYIDYNNNGSFADFGEAIFTATTSLLGTQTFTKTYSIPGGKYGMYRMRVMTSNTHITGPNMIPSSGEIEEYNLNMGTTPTATTAPVNLTMATCDIVRPNIENIMDYSDCPKMFTEGQTDKVRLSATGSAGYRYVLISNENLYFTGIVDRTIVFNTITQKNDTTYTPTTVSPCAPVADFSYNKSTTCEGQSILFTNTSYNGTGLTYAWEFEGGSPSTSTLAAQSVTYSAQGTYSVSLTTTNAYGVSTKTINTITTNWNAPSRTLPYMENFDSGTWWPTDWTVPTNSNDIATPTWELSSYGAGSSTSPTSPWSLSLPSANTMPFSPPFFVDYSANVDVIETPAFDLSNVSFVKFDFDYSFARKTGVVADTFKLQYSLDCGGTWRTFPTLYTYTGTPTPTVQTVFNTTNMSAFTGGTVNAAYMPWSSATSISDPTYKWRTASTGTTTINSNLIQNQRSVKFRFWFKNDVENGLSQNLYIDNVNITGTVGIREFENSIGLSIYPNPTNSASTVEFTSPSNSKVSIIMHDVMGRVVEQSDLNVNAGILNKYSVNNSGKLTSGIYFITVMMDNKKVVKKLIIN